MKVNRGALEKEIKDIEDGYNRRRRAADVIEREAKFHRVWSRARREGKRKAKEIRAQADRIADQQLAHLLAYPTNSDTKEG